MHNLGTDFPIAQLLRWVSVGLWPYGPFANIFAWHQRDGSVVRIWTTNGLCLLAFFSKSIICVTWLVRMGLWLLPNHLPEVPSFDRKKYHEVIIVLCLNLLTCLWKLCFCLCFVHLKLFTIFKDSSLNFFFKSSLLLFLLSILDIR